MPPTPQQSLQPSVEAMQLRMEVERTRTIAVAEWTYGGEHRWTARDRAVVARMEQYLDESCKGNEPCTSYSRTIYNTKMATDGYDIAYTFTHNNITLEHTAMNDKNTITHTDAYNTQF